MIIDRDRAPTSAGKRGMVTQHLSLAGGLTQFGVGLDTLAPGGWSSSRHWHDREDEFLYLLSGTATLVDNTGAHDLAPGDAVTWRHGDPNAHHLTNRSAAPARWLIVGSRVLADTCHYPDSGDRQVNSATRWQVLDARGNILRDGDLPPDLLNLSPVWGTAFTRAHPLPNIQGKGAVAPVTGSGYPDGFDDLGAYQAVPLSDAGGLSQFGAFAETLMPGAQSSQRHWHSSEDEFLYVLTGEVTLIEDDGPHALRPGDAVAWPKGVPNAHCLRNASAEACTYLVVGSRLQDDDCHYPDIDLHYSRRAGQRVMSHKDGTPYPGWPKETNR